MFGPSILSCLIHQSEKIPKRISYFYKKQESDTTKKRSKSRSLSFRKVNYFQLFNFLRPKISIKPISYTVRVLVIGYNYKWPKPLISTCLFGANSYLLTLKGANLYVETECFDPLVQNLITTLHMACTMPHFAVKRLS